MSDVVILRDLARRYADVCRRDVQRTRRDLWRSHNSLRRTRPLTYVRAIAWHEVKQADITCNLRCVDPFYRHYEDTLRNLLY